MLAQASVDGGDRPRRGVQVGHHGGDGLSRAELARQAAVPASALRNWEGDRGMPGLAAAVRLAAALGVPVERFAEGVEDPVEEEPPAPEKRARRGEGSTH